MQGGQDTCMPPALLPYQVALTAPAFVPRAADVQNAAAFLQRAGAVCTLGASCFLPRRFSRADDQVRAAELTRFLCCGAYDIVLCCRGGYGAARLLPYLDKALLQRARAVRLRRVRCARAHGRHGFCRGAAARGAFGFR